MRLLKDIEKTRQRLGVSPSRLSIQAGLSSATYGRALRAGSARKETLDALIAELERIEAQEIAKRKRLAGIATDKPERSAA